MIGSVESCFSEEMVSSTNNIFWSPDARFIAYLVTDDTQVDRIEFTNYGSTKYPETVSSMTCYPDDEIRCSVNVKDEVSKLRYSSVNRFDYDDLLFQVIVAYPKAGTPNPKVTLKVFDTTRNSAETTTIVAPTGFVGRFVSLSSRICQ